jgi:hypothetical protein
VSRREDVICDTRSTEPSLDELLGDPVMQLLMRRDGVTEKDVRAPLGELKDARRVVSSGIAVKSGASLSADRSGDHKKNVAGSRSSDASTFPPQIHMMTKRLRAGRAGNHIQRKFAKDH